MCLYQRYNHTIHATLKCSLSGEYFLKRLSMSFTNKCHATKFIACNWSRTNFLVKKRDKVLNKNFSQLFLYISMADIQGCSRTFFCNVGGQPTVQTHNGIPIPQMKVHWYCCYLLCAAFQCQCVTSWRVRTGSAQNQWTNVLYPYLRPPNMIPPSNQVQERNLITLPGKYTQNGGIQYLFR